MLDATLLIVLLVMLLLGKLLGDLVGRLGFSPLIGQMTAGILLGPMVLDFVRLNDSMQMLTDIGILFMMFLMGLSIDLEKVMGETVYKATLISLCGGTLAFATTAVITAMLGFSVNSALLVGVSFISTSTAIGFMVLSGFGDRHSKVFKTVMAAGVIDDIYAILGLALFTSFLFTTIDVRMAFVLLLGVLGFIIFVVSFGRTITDRLIAFARKSRDEQPIIAFSLILMFFVAWLGQSVNLASVSGAFLAGTILARSQLSYKVITPKIEAISEGFFIPLFFVYTGVRINAFEIFSSAPVDLVLVSIPIDVVLFLGVLMAVMASKYLATWVTTTIIGEYKPKEIHKMALTMMPMGEYTLVIGQIGLTMMYDGAPIIDTKLYSVLALVVLTLSIIVPIMLRKAYEN
ncbi:MAG: glutathione-regulated potassium-efflux system protein KefC [Methanocella sp. PtaU1.Bin125]|nr:MAG: glutathione-regulated potassium-efflux system protein KefC [Methanocella sp. PtaU1.Bin125]